jgi:hypothetical protein
LRPPRIVAPKTEENPFQINDFCQFRPRGHRADITPAGPTNKNVLLKMNASDNNTNQVVRDGLEDPCREFRSIAAIFLFPYFLPLVAVSVFAFAWMVFTPNDSTVLGISSDGLVWFMMFCVVFGGLAQVAIGVPICFLLSWIGAPFWRRLMAVVAVALALIPFGWLWTESVVTLVVVVGCIAAGVRISMRTFRPQENQEAEQDVPPNA